MKNPVRFLSQDKIWIIHAVKAFEGLNSSSFRDIITISILKGGLFMKKGIICLAIIMYLLSIVGCQNDDRAKLYDPGFTTEFREATK